MKGQERWPEIPWGPGWLNAVTRQMLQSLSPKEFASLRGFLGIVPDFKWGSCCSGTESPAWCIVALFAELRALGFKVPSVEALFSAELSAEKRDFIETCSPMVAKHMFADMADVLKPAARSRHLQNLF